VRPVRTGSSARVRFSPIAREGLSSAVTVEAEVGLGEDAAGRWVPGNRCVLKVGPRADLAEEAQRYSQFVKFGVRLPHRVELLAECSTDALGAVCYSFAGGVFGKDVVSLDELLRDHSRVGPALQTIERLFDARRKEWYAVDAGRVAVVPYFRRTYNTNFRSCHERLDRSLSKLAGRFPSVRRYQPAREDSDGSVEIAGAKLVIPRISMFGGGSFVAGVQACLAHGDMHGGNVMVELGLADQDNGEEAGTEMDVLRVCLIDYRSAGPAPRCIDAAALDASMRLADAECIAGEANSNGAGAQSLSEAAMELALGVAAKRAEAELAIGRQVWGIASTKRTERHLGAEWQAVPSLLAQRMRENFVDLPVRDYLVAGLACGMRQMGFGLDPLARVRTLAWLSAQYTLLQATENGAS